MRDFQTIFSLMFYLLAVLSMLADKYHAVKQVALNRMLSANHNFKISSFEEEGKANVSDSLLQPDIKGIDISAKDQDSLTSLICILRLNIRLQIYCKNFDNLELCKVDSKCSDFVFSIDFKSFFIINMSYVSLVWSIFVQPYIKRLDQLKLFELD